jgi:hypothetical protein
MGIKVLFEIKGNMYDWWEVRSIERVDEYDEDISDICHKIVLNRTATATNVVETTFKYDSLEERDEDYMRIRSKLIEYENVIIIGENLLQ